MKKIPDPTTVFPDLGSVSKTGRSDFVLIVVLILVLEKPRSASIIEATQMSRMTFFNNLTKLRAPLPYGFGMTIVGSKHQPYIIEDWGVLNQKLVTAYARELCECWWREHGAKEQS